MDRKKANFYRLSIIIVIIILILIIGIYNINRNKNKVNTQTNTSNNENYTETNGVKTNTSQSVSQNKQVGDVVIEQSTITYTGGTSKLTSKVTNNGPAVDNLRFTVKFIANDGSVIAQSVGYVGQIGTNEVRFIDSYITTDVSNAKDIKYEIIT